MTIKIIMNPATEDGRNRQAFNHPPQGNETLAAWQRGHRLFVEEMFGARASPSVRVTRGREEDDHHKRG